VNPIQMAMQLRFLLRAVTWPDGGSVVFGDRGVFVFAGTPTGEQIPSVAPFCLVGIDTGTPDENDPGLILQRFSVITAAETTMPASPPANDRIRDSVRK